MSVDVLCRQRAGLGESPVWDARHQQLWWVDALVGRLHRRDHATGTVTSVGLGRRLGGLALAEDDLVAMADRDVVAVPRDPEVAAAVRLLHRADAGLHDCGVAPDGAVWVGTLSPDPQQARGGMLRVDADGVTSLDLVAGYRMPNGISWTSDGAVVHVVDSLRHEVLRSRFTDGREVERERWVVGGKADGLPDGVCADRDGGLWVAYWGTGRVVRYDRDGRLERLVEVPARYATSCCFGGPDLRHLFVTSARHDAGPEETEAGALFVVETHVEGLPVPTARLGGSIP